MIHDVPIITVDISYIDEAVSSVHVKFIDQCEATYVSAVEIDEVFTRIAEQQKIAEQEPPAYGDTDI